MQITMFDQNGSKTGMHTLNDAMFDVPWREGLVHQALLRQLANARSPIAHTKTRGERRGGGRKPWKQKHTGRARVGSNRSPLWRKGGVIFGPRGVENHSIAMPHQQRVYALFSVLSRKARDNQIIGLDSFATESPKTKQVAQLLKKLSIDRSCLIVVPASGTILARCARNIPSVKVLSAAYLNIADLLQYDKVLCMKESFTTFETIWEKHTKKISREKKKK